MDKDKKDIRIKAEACYNKDLHPLLIESLLQNGVNANEIIKKLGITPGIYRYWAKNFPSHDTRQAACRFENSECII